ncbi:VOC family protein [Promicromonospora sukumoe]|uniref:VOC family protein n=1 Tax=Promicromonospora sukumoe TaxID=88382 RepID=UPI0003681076|nr:VOC family protein [Promicromonospora sukumoe]
MDYRLEVITLPVRDVEAAIAFYRDRLGFRLDVDWAPTDTFRVAQLTPAGSATSVQLGVGITDARPGSAAENYLVVTDIEAAHRELARRGADPGPLAHKADPQHWAGRYHPGPDPDRSDYASSFVVTDPDGNTWRVQERGHAHRRATTTTPGAPAP